MFKREPLSTDQSLWYHAKSNRAWKRRHYELYARLNRCNRRARRAYRDAMLFLNLHVLVQP